MSPDRSKALVLIENYGKQTTTAVVLLCNKNGFLKSEEYVSKLAVGCAMWRKGEFVMDMYEYDRLVKSVKYSGNAWANSSVSVPTFEDWLPISELTSAVDNLSRSKEWIRTVLKKTPGKSVPKIVYCPQGYVQYDDARFIDATIVDFSKEGTLISNSSGDVLGRSGAEVWRKNEDTVSLIKGIRLSKDGELYGIDWGTKSRDYEVPKLSKYEKGRWTSLPLKCTAFWLL